MGICWGSAVCVQNVFFENSSRVPLIISSPNGFKSGRVNSAVSLVDLLPTLDEFARDGLARDYPTPIEGRSLLPHLSGSKGHDEVFGDISRKEPRNQFT